MDQPDFKTANINMLWLQNIFENLKNLEYMERIAREGTDSLIDYIKVPEQDRSRYFAAIQYKNLKMMISEMFLLLADLQPVITSQFYKEIKESLDKLQESITEERKFIKSYFSQVSKSVYKAELTTNFDVMLKIVSSMRSRIIKEISHLLFVEAPY